VSGGDLKQIQKYTEFAKEDFRDILIWAEYPRQSKKWSMPDGPKKRKLAEAEQSRIRRLVIPVKPYRTRYHRYPDIR